MVLLDTAFEPRRGIGWAVSLGSHALGALILLLLPGSVFEASPPAASVARRVTPLVAPPQELTQTAPNRGRVSRDVTLDALLPRAPVRVPAAVPSTARTEVPRLPSAPSAKPVLEAPSLDSGTPQLDTRAQVGAGLPALPPAPPRIQTEEEPKLAFETPGRPAPVPRPGGGGPLAGRLPMPSDSVAEASRAAIRRPGGGGGMLVEDVEIPGSSGVGGGVYLPGSPPRSSSSLELLSDPDGVDLKPYLIQVLAAVKRRWQAVVPESARLGRQGKVQIQFSIDRSGQVPKLVIAVPSGTYALDRAAVAGIDQARPFPPFPAAFKGEQLRLQFTFLYNTR